MDPELKAALDELRAKIGKNVDALARVDQIAQLAQTTGADLKVLRGEVEQVRKFVEERDKQIRALQEQARTEAMRRDPIRDRTEALTMLGMIVRSELCRAQGMPLPVGFSHETDLVRGYREQCLSRATLTPGSTTGSYLVPTLVDSGIQSGVEEVSEFLGLCDWMPGLPAAGTFNFTFLATRPTMQAKRASVDTAMTASDPVFSQMAVTPYETYIFFGVDNKLFLQSAVALGGYFDALCRDSMVDKLAYWALRADGTSTYNSITGLLNETTAAYLYQLGAGKTGFADLTDANLTAIKAKCLKRGRGPRGRWLCDLEVQGVIENLDRTGKVPVITYAQDGTARCKQNPIVNDEYMPGLDESAASTGFLLYGDLATLLIAMVGGIEIKSDQSVRFDKNQTAFRATTVMDIKRKPVATLILGKTAAA